VLRFAIPAGIVCGAATFAGYYLATENGGAAFAQASSTATITLFFLAMWALVLIARPYTWWRIGLVAAMAAGFHSARLSAGPPAHGDRCGLG
jgi:cation-transporting ATPase E